jgi:hypothetical protein
MESLWQYHNRSQNSIIINLYIYIYIKSLIVHFVDVEFDPRLWYPPSALPTYLHTYNHLQSHIQILYDTRCKDGTKYQSSFKPWHNQKALTIGKCAKINETISMGNTRKLMTTIKVPFITFSIELWAYKIVKILKHITSLNNSMKNFMMP